jgi:predicted O-methyltransferase YrrM
MQAKPFTYKDIPGHFSFSDVYDMVVDRAVDGATFVEVGTWFGTSAAYMGSKIKESRKRIAFYAIDNFTAEGSGPVLLGEAAKLGGNFYSTFIENIRRCGVSDFVMPVASDSTEAASRFEDSSLDFVFIDACHTYEKVKMDIQAWLQKIKPGGILAGHDYNESHPGVRKAVNELFAVPGFTIMTHSWVTRIGGGPPESPPLHRR